jgi:NAD-dependent dihydropyrimidine dehydrogenase PreA subunit
MSNIKKWEELDHWVEIDLDLCTGISDCASICPVEVYSVVDGKVQANNISECIACGACQNVCPNNAILRHWAWK